MKTVFTLLGIFLFLNVHAQTQNKVGSLDSSFGSNGAVYANNLFVYTGCLQQDNKILAAGNVPGGYGLMRFLSNGVVDKDFGEKGIAGVTDSLFSGGTVKGIVVLADSEILTAGPATLHIGLAKFKSNGKRDSTFGINGTTLVTYGELENITCVGVQQDGKIVVAGGTKTAFETDMLLVRFNADGSIDTDFGIDGRVKNSSGAQVNCLAIQTDGKIVTAGQFYVTAGPDEFIINRYNPDGSIDKTFGINGMVKTVFGTGTGIDNPFSVKILKDGSFLVSGIGNWFSGGGDKSFMAIARYKADGSLDSSFGVFGKSKIIFPNESSAAKGMCLQDDGKIILGGYVGDNDISTNWDGAMARLNSDGILDSSFGISGLVQTDFGASEQMENVMLQKTGDIVLVGNSQITELKEDALVTGYLSDKKNQKQIIITKIKHWLQHHNGFTWDNNSNVNNYVVQRSYDGIHFNSIATIHAGNNSNYTYEDASPLSGTNYYRLQTTSIKGSINYSNVIAIANDDIKISPNPATNILRIQGLPSSSNIKITVVDIAGNVAINQQLKANSASSYNLNIASLKQGNYLLKIETNDDVVTKQFVKE